MNPTLSMAQGATDIPLIEQTLGDFFDDMAARQGEHEALVSVHEGKRYSYRELQREVDRLASALLGLGLVPGDRVGIWSHNNAPWVLMQLATAKVGIVLVNINPAYRTSELEYALNKVACKALVTMKRFKTSDYVGMLRELAPELADAAPGALQAARLPHLRTVAWIDAAGADGELPGLLRFSALHDSGRADDPQVVAIAKTLKATDPINIQFTSGTTGFPKGATLTHRNILNNGFFIGECMKLSPVDRLCITVIWHRVERLERHPLPRALAAMADHMRRRHVMRDPIHPCSERASAVEAFEAPPDAQVNLLEEILSLVRVGLIRTRETPKRGAVRGRRFLVEIVPARMAPRLRLEIDHIQIVDGVGRFLHLPVIEATDSHVDPGNGSYSTADRGRRMVKIVPSRSVESTVSDPPWAPEILSTMNSPSPRWSAPPLPLEPRWVG